MRNLDRGGSGRIVRSKLRRDGVAIVHAGRSLGHRDGKRKTLARPRA
jgi:hypothetical protein